MRSWVLFVVVQEGVRGTCCVTVDMEEAVEVAFNHRGDCSVLVIGIQASRAEKRTIHVNADEEEIRNRILNGIQFVTIGIGSEPLC